MAPFYDVTTIVWTTVTGPLPRVVPPKTDDIDGWIDSKGQPRPVLKHDDGEADDSLQCGACSLNLTQQQSSTECVANVSFGCGSAANPQEPKMWVKGCTGWFRCCGHRVRCESLKYARHECGCAADTPTPAPPPAPGTASRARVAINASAVIARTASGYVHGRASPLPAVI